MTLVNTFASYGITLGMVQMAIIAGIVVYIIGTYWKVLLTGAGIITIAIILLYSESNGNKPTEMQSTEVKPTEVNNIPVVTESSNAPVLVESPNAPEPVPTPKVMPKVPDAFMEDCMKEAEYTKDECQKIWTNP
jgi:hypothetical protein